MKIKIVNWKPTKR